MANDEDIGKALKERSMKEFGERTQGKPTPTQEENDRAALGQAVVGAKHEADGSKVDEAVALLTGKELRAKAAEQFAERTKGKPTPTQDEIDKAAMGEAVVGGEHEADGANLDEANVGATRAMEAKPGGGYQTRQATAQSPRRVVAPEPPSSH
jgi:hypothetical protein